MRATSGGRALTIATWCAVATTAVSAQTAPVPQQPMRTAPWAFIDAIGYGGLATLTGYVVAFASAPEDELGPSDSALPMIVLTGAGGAVLGAYIGSRARRAAAEGRPFQADTVSP